ncbi:hypothetical protein BDV38DRAFT_12969 [Aspergillus pseudotamarii]|uniref:Uncharacterized protein n=1 Tax=Aspergillus pseudotamarii TaxID=132259 RepID=A0A5N6SF08_ASPPS|nr:uncharacterized protein BDV38DRAFT_12969 [Aspergillus pseudotamarii]KAE8131694.1 hypothetical protein BDV38DRAFT_12969 [Aspergillus pseudotamarii]
MASSWLPSPWRIHRERRVDPERTVDELVRKYYTIDQQSTNDILREILGSPEQASLLFNALRRQVSLIKCRSQAFEDGQITTYDRALLKLSRNGENLTDTGALELYLTEFLGIVPISPASQSRAILAKQLELENVLSRASTHGSTPEIVIGHKEQPETLFVDQAPLNPEHEPRDHNDHHYVEQIELKTNSTRHAQQVFDRVDRLLEVYHRAKDEYYKALQTEGFVGIETVRFLRDTAENILRYLHANGLSDHTSIPDVEQVFLIARDKATQLTGGRKRHFDEGVERHGRRRKRRALDSYRPGK